MSDKIEAAIPAAVLSVLMTQQNPEEHARELKARRDKILKVYPAERDKAVDPNTFEIALVLGGTVSAGAYTAGFVDFFVEALDQWAIARSKATPGDKVPRHKVKLKIVTGASGGGVTALLLARALKFKFPPARLPEKYPNRTAEEQAALDRNPFYRLWVRQLDARSLLEPNRDWAQRNDPMPSLFSGEFLTGVVQGAANWTGDAVDDSTVREGRLAAYGEVLPLALTLTNLRGVPFLQFIPNSTNQKRFYTQHADFIRLAVDVRPGLQTQQLDYQGAPDAHLVSEAGGRSVLTWQDAALFARATGAFPFGFPSVTLRRPLADYEYRWAVVQGETTPTQDNGETVYHARLNVVPLEPATSVLADTKVPDGTYRFAAVDGGAMNNEPIELARTALAGILGRNPRKPLDANRCVILVDPFADPPGSGPKQIDSLRDLPLPFISALVANNRFSTADITVFADPDARSRTMVTPVRDRSIEGQTRTVSGSFAIATSFLGAFGGFLGQQYREHDFMLGRANAARFFAEHFTLPEGNAALRGQAANFSQDQRSSRGELRIVPLFGTAKFNYDPQYFSTRLPWPTEPLKLAPLHAMFKPKIEELMKRSAKGVTENATFGWALGSGASWLYRDSTVKKMVAAVKQSLKDHGLPYEQG